MKIKIADISDIARICVLDLFNEILLRLYSLKEEDIQLHEQLVEEIKYNPMSDPANTLLVQMLYQVLHDLDKKDELPPELKYKYHLTDFLIIESGILASIDQNSVREFMAKNGFNSERVEEIIDLNSKFQASIEAVTQKLQSDPESPAQPYIGL